MTDWSAIIKEGIRVFKDPERRRARWEVVIRLREQGMTWQQVGDEIGVSRERARQLYSQGLLARREGSR